jgi:glycerol-3-phosphate O-acyltransferase/dihydroxyacetone phosphate acyltransferase
MSTEPALPSGRPEPSWVKRLAKALLALFFRRVEVTGLSALPERGGGLLLAWHPNGMIDPALVLAAFPRRVVFGARHGLFRWPLLGAILKSVAVPIYRRQDLARSADEAGAKRGNEASLGALADAVAGGSFAMLFPEGDSHDQSRPLELKTGAARLYLDALARCRARAARERGDSGPSAPWVIPVGLHYDGKRFFRSRALVVFHAPLAIDAEIVRAEASEEERREAARRLTERFAAALDRTVLATDDWRDHHLMHRLRRLIRAERAERAGGEPGPVDMRERLLGFARVWTAYRELGEDQSAAVVAIRRRVGAYDRLLRRLGLEDHELDRDDPPPPHGGRLATLALQRLLLDWILPPLALVGLLANLPAALLLAGLARLAARREKDVATIKLFFGAVLFPASWIALGVLAAWGQGALADRTPALAHRPWAAAAAAVLLAAGGGLLVLFYGRLSRLWGRALLVRAKRRLFRRWVERLRGERAAIFDEATALAARLELPGRIGPSGEILAEDGTADRSSAAAPRPSRRGP